MSTPAPTASPLPPEGADDSGDIAALAKGGRTNFFGFLIRLVARLPFLFVAGRLYGAEVLGIFAYALVVVELTSQVATLGQKRALAAQLAAENAEPAHIVADGLMLTVLFGGFFTAALMLFPQPMFPNGGATWIALLLPLTIIPYAFTEIALAAQAYKYDIAATVRARAVVEPWTISLVAVAAYYVVPKGGLELAYIASILAAMATAFHALIKSYGVPRGWRPSLSRTWTLARANLPIAGADMVEWGTRRLDIAILGLFAGPATVGIYYIAQQVASLPQKLKTSFEPILGPVITKNLKTKNYAAIAQQVCQVGFWIIAAQAGIALALGIPGEAVMGLVGPSFVGGTGALALLLAAEVVAATAVVSEAALVYMARKRNLLISLLTIALQAGLTIALMLLIERFALPPGYRAAAAAGSLAVALGVASLVKAWLLSRILGHRVNNWRWALVWAAAPAAVVGFVFTQFTPEWMELALGVPAILGAYGYFIWKRGFGPEDRVLFKRNGGDD
ncbi:lipopolysaccharide biosynthesis protein [Altererythrobacter sp. CAU 1778]